MGYEVRLLQGRQVEEGTGQPLEVKPSLSCSQWEYHHSLPEHLHYLWSLGGGKKPDFTVWACLTFSGSLDKPKQNCRQDWVRSLPGRL